MSRRAIVTLHDVAPNTLDDCRATLALLRARGAAPVTLLVVPGTGWTTDALGTLRGFLHDGCLLAGHGWTHQAPVPATTYHRVHSLVISRNEGEHLSRSQSELRALVRRCAQWFPDVGLEKPDFYVPPAWAMGKLTPADLAELPFRYYETLTGIRDADTGRFRLMPLVGYLADTRARALALTVINGFNHMATRVMRRPLRISIHPPDHRLHLGEALRGVLSRDWNCITVAEAMGSEHQRPPRVS